MSNEARRAFCMCGSCPDCKRAIERGRLGDFSDAGGAADKDGSRPWVRVRIRLTPEDVYQQSNSGAPARVAGRRGRGLKD